MMPSYFDHQRGNTIEDWLDRGREDGLDLSEAQTMYRLFYIRYIPCFYFGLYVIPGYLPEKNFEIVEDLPLFWSGNTLRSLFRLWFIIRAPSWHDGKVDQKKSDFVLKEPEC